MNFLSAFEIFMGSLAIGLIVILGIEFNAGNSGFKDIQRIVGFPVCYQRVSL